MTQHLLTGLAFAMLFSPLIHAQQPDESLESIVVTGTRTNTTLSELSGNITRVSQQDINQTQSTHFSEIMHQVAGVWISRGNGQEHLTAIRSPVLTGAGSCGAFLVAQDGISVRAPGFCNANQLFDVNANQAQAIDVVRGPASVIYGSNAVHGVINVVSPDPASLPRFSVDMEAGPNEFGRLSLRMAEQFQQHQFALYGSVTDDGGYKVDSGYRQDKLNVLHQTEHSQFNIKNVFSYSDLNQQTAGFIQGFEAYKDDALKRLNPNPEAYRNSRSMQGYSQIEFAFNAFDLVLKPYFRAHDMQFLQHFVPWQATEENGHNSVGLLTAASLKKTTYQLTFGLDLDATHGWLREFQSEEFSASIPQGEHYHYDVNARVISPYIDSRWYLTDSLTLNAGIRYDHTRYDYTNKLADGIACASDVEDCRFIRPADQQRDFSNFSGRLGINYAISGSHMLYSQLSHGFRAPQATELFRLQNNQRNAPLDAEKMLSIELGFRGQLLENAALFYDISAYAMGKSDHIFQDTERQNVSAGKTSHRGLEVAVNWQLSAHWKVNVALDASRHRYENNVAIARGVDIRHNHIDTAPEKNASVSLQWQADYGNAELEWVYLDDYYLDPENSARYEGHQLVNLRTSVPVSDNFKLSLRIMNLFNQDYAERADYAFGNYRYFVGEPRALYLQAHYSL